ncbi:MAG TPA: GNAT family N-acetyltransferase [Candidatus Limnocylindria bacterium]|nr:GNAT family N-acetyltransferase [Candidatus Limnocylindria bacterium]
MEPVALTDGTVVLRALLPRDIDDVTLACQDLETQAWTTVPVPYTRENSLDFVANHGPGSQGWTEGRNPLWVITLAAEGAGGRYGGALDLRLDDEGGAEVGYALAPWLRGQGNMQRALRLACRWAFEDRGLARIVWYAHVGNTASRRTAEAVGFKVLDGILRQALVSRDVRHDGWVGDLLPGDLR